MWVTYQNRTVNTDCVALIQVTGTAVRFQETPNRESSYLKFEFNDEKKADAAYDIIIDHLETKRSIDLEEEFDRENV